MHLELIGPHPFERDEKGKQRIAIGTIFPLQAALYTLPPAVHACQRAAYIDHVNANRAKKLLPALMPAEEETLSANSVDLIFEPGQILIRPDPERMDLAFAADELLQELTSKRNIKFLSVSDARVREAIRRRGECWRLSSIPKTVEGKQKLVFSSKVAIDAQPIYFYNRLTGTRWLTWQAFCELSALDDAALARQLREIAGHAGSVNRLGCPEIDFFAVDPKLFGARDFAGIQYEQLGPELLRAKFAELSERFRAAVPVCLLKDGCQQSNWSAGMISALFLEGNEALTEQMFSGLSQEFFLQVEWLPGGRFEEGEFLFDPIFDEADAHPEDEPLQRLCDWRARGIIFNLIREFGDIEYINIGRVPESLSIQRPQRLGRRGVYITELKSRSELRPIKRFVRLQKWDVWEHLDEGKELLQSIEESEEYTDYWLDRRLGCRQLGMNLTRRLVLRRLGEIYKGSQARYRGRPIHSSYFEREYLPGVATDKLPADNYRRAGYASRFAALLGQAAASNLLVGRAIEQGKRPVFDDGDEVVIESENGLPLEILYGDHSGAFGEYEGRLEQFAEHYAKPVNNRLALVPDPVEFAEIYLEALRTQLLHIQGDYRKRKRAFDTLFKHCKYDPKGSFAFRWERVLRRLDQTDVDAVLAAIRQKVKIPALSQPNQSQLSVGQTA